MSNFATSQTAARALRIARRLRRPLAIAALAISLLLVIKVIVEQWQALASVPLSYSWLHYLQMIALSTATIATTSILHFFVLRMHSTEHITVSMAGYAYGASQLARYIPGKIFGVMLEAELLAPSIRLGSLVIVLLEQSLLTYFWSALLGGWILLYCLTHEVWLLAAIPLSAVLTLLMARNGIPTLQLAALLMKVRQLKLQPLSTTRTSSAQKAAGLNCGLMVLVQWLPFFALCAVLTHSSMGIAGSTGIAASYIMASIIGSALIVLPSGLVVREAAFTGLASMIGASVGDAFVWAIILRLTLTIGDVVSTAGFWLSRQIAERRFRTFNTLK